MADDTVTLDTLDAQLTLLETALSAVLATEPINDDPETDIIESDSMVDEDVFIYWDWLQATGRFTYLALTDEVQEYIINLIIYANRDIDANYVYGTNEDEEVTLRPIII